VSDYKKLSAGNRHKRWDAYGAGCSQSWQLRWVGGLVSSIRGRSRFLAVGRVFQVSAKGEFQEELTKSAGIAAFIAGGRDFSILRRFWRLENLIKRYTNSLAKSTGTKEHNI
jgi:hypothetical protein